MNRKTLFWIIFWWLLLIIIIIILIIKGSSSQNKQIIYKSDWKFHIWTVGDSSTKFNEFLSDFKLDNKSISNIEFEITNFDNFEDYNLALQSAFLQNKAPDIFVLNNNEKSIFENKVYALSDKKINIHNFRQNYKSIFIDDLITSNWEGKNKKEFLKWIPVWYETLWVFYNALYRFKRADFTNLSYLKPAIKKIKTTRDVIPLWIWNGSTVAYASDLIAQEFLLNKAKSIKDIKDSQIKDSFSDYFSYWDINWINWYNALFDEAKNSKENNIDLFIDKKVAAIIAYPRIIFKLQSAGFNKRLLYAAPYPHAYSWDGPSLANYNYFVINSDSKQKLIAIKLLQYLNSDLWAWKYLKKFPYYLPARRTLEDKLEEKNISNFYRNVTLWDFYSDEPLSSFDKWNKVLFDKNIIKILDNFSSYLSKFNIFQENLLCKIDKLNLINLEKKCE